jgi:alkylation response protein AidB-like acyl-CoA dehydrogenase
MNFAFSEEQDEFREMLRRFFGEKVPAVEVRRMSEAPGGFDRALWKQMGEELGLQGIHLSEEVGGQGFGFLELGIVMEEMGRVLLPCPYLASSVLAAGAIRLAGSPQDHAALLPGLASGEEIGTLAWVDEGAGWRATDICMEAREEGDDALLSGIKTAVLSGEVATRIIVAARQPGSSGIEGVGLYSLDAGAAGVKVEPEEALDATRPIARLELDGARARPLGLPGGAGMALEKTLGQAAIALATEAVGSAQSALDMAVEYTKVRVQFGRPIGSFQAVKHKAAEVLLELELARSAAYWAGWVADEDGRELAEAAPLAKSVCSEALMKAATECVQLHGGIGFTWEHDAQLYYKRAASTRLLLGEPTVHRAALADRLGF